MVRFMKLHTLLRDPLTHFLAIALLAIALTPSNEAPSQQIALSDTDVTGLLARFEWSHGRAPAADERTELIRRAVHEEILVTEARALGLDLGDPIVRGRLVQKMAHLARGATPPEAPDEASLQRWFEAHADRYTRPTLLDFEHVFFRRDGKESASERDRALEELRIGGDPKGLGDPFTHGRHFRGRTLPDVRTLWGSEATELLANAEKDRWFALDSPHGAHAVRITSRVPGKAVPLESVRARVLRDWQTDQTRRREAQAIEALRAKYTIHVSGEAWTP
jgi:hypothetical protein